MRVMALFCLFAALLLAGCSKKEPGGEVAVEVIDGVEYVHNPATPLHPERKVVFEEELRVGGEDAGAEGVLGQPGEVAVDAAGRIYVADRVDWSIRVYDRDGTFLRRNGQRGGGPGEFQSIGALHFLPDGRLAVLDYNSNRISLFDSSGQFLNSFLLTIEVYDIFMATDSTLTVREERRPREERQLLVKTIDLDGKERVSFGEFTAMNMEALRSKDMAIYIVVPHRPHSIFAGAQKAQWLYHCLNSDYRIEVYDHTGRRFRVIDRPYQPVPYPEAEKEAFRERFKKSPNKALAKMIDDLELPKYKTVIEDMLVDDAGNLWLRTNETKKEGEQRWWAYDVFNEKGEYRLRTWSPVRIDLILKGKMYSIVYDSEIGPTVRRYGMKWKESSL